MTTKKKYEALVLIWVDGEKRYVEPGETFERTDKQAEVLLEKGFIRPAKAEVKSAASEKKES